MDNLYHASGLGRVRSNHDAKLSLFSRALRHEELGDSMGQEQGCPIVTRNTNNGQQEQRRPRPTAPKASAGLAPLQQALNA